MHLYNLPHHDGSPLYVPHQRPALGDVVTLRVRVPAGYDVESVHARTVVDGEPRFLPCAPDPDRNGPDSWWRADLEILNPVQNYRFYLTHPAAEPVWLTSAGIVANDLTDATDFRIVTHEPPPGWMRDAVIYQIFPDRYARSTAADARELPEWAIACDWDGTTVIGQGPGTSQQIFGGDLDGIAEHLDHIQSLGVDTVYLTPIFPARSNHRYDASTFDAVDPLLGGEEALARLAKAVRDRGMRLVGDITTNHCGAGHEWFTRAQAGGPEREMFYKGPDGDFVYWNGVRTLPKLNWNSGLTRERMIGVLRRWLPYFDGWRVDVANMTGRYRDEDATHEIARMLRTAVAEVAPDAMFVAEHMHDFTGDLDKDGWHGTMNYGAFTRPVWCWLAGSGSREWYFGTPGGVPVRDGGATLATMRAFLGPMSWRSITHSWHLLDSHDSARIRTVVGTLAGHVAAAALQFTLPGTPMIFAGTEFGLTGWNGEASRTPMPWSRPADRDEATLSAYRSLIALRRAEPALRDGGLRWAHVSHDALIFVRETPSSSVAVAVRRAPGAAFTVPGLGSGAALFGEGDLVDGMIPASSDACAHVWRLS